jgi:uncharacterized membrane protein YfcA
MLVTDDAISTRKRMTGKRWRIFTASLRKLCWNAPGCHLGSVVSVAPARGSGADWINWVTAACILATSVLMRFTNRPSASGAA